MRSSRVLLGMSLVVLFCAAGWAQDTGSITGTVTDASGAAVSGANVALTSVEQGTKRSAKTNSSGEYLFAAVPVGKYDIDVSAQGFKKYQAKGVVLRVAEKARVDVALAVGAISEQVMVEGTQVAQVETQSSDLSGTVTGNQINGLALNGRNFTQLVTLVPGVSNQTGQDEGTVGVGRLGLGLDDEPEPVVIGVGLLLDVREVCGHLLGGHVAVTEHDVKRHEVLPGSSTVCSAKDGDLSRVRGHKNEICEQEQ